jgi:hypothetical protein
MANLIYIEHLNPENQRGRESLGCQGKSIAKDSIDEAIL